jgi:hypothetical protein
MTNNEFWEGYAKDMTFIEGVLSQDEIMRIYNKHLLCHENMSRNVGMWETTDDGGTILYLSSEDLITLGIRKNNLGKTDESKE